MAQERFALGNTLFCPLEQQSNQGHEGKDEHGADRHGSRCVGHTTVLGSVGARADRSSVARGSGVVSRSRSQRRIKLELIRVEGVEATANDEARSIRDSGVGDSNAGISDPSEVLEGEISSSGDGSSVAEREEADAGSVSVSLDREDTVVVSSGGILLSEETEANLGLGRVVVNGGNNDVQVAVNNRGSGHGVLNSLGFASDEALQAKDTVSSADGEGGSLNIASGDVFLDDRGASIVASVRSLTNGDVSHRNSLVVNRSRLGDLENLESDKAQANTDGNADIIGRQTENTLNADREDGATVGAEVDSEVINLGVVRSARTSQDDLLIISSITSSVDGADGRRDDASGTSWVRASRVDEAGGELARAIDAGTSRGQELVQGADALTILVAAGSLGARSLTLSAKVDRAILTGKGSGADALERQGLISGLNRDANGARRAAISESVARVNAATAERTEPTRTAHARAID